MDKLFFFSLAIILLVAGAVFLTIQPEPDEAQDSTIATSTATTSAPVVPEEYEPPATSTIPENSATPKPDTCKPTGCSSQICSDTEVITTCEFKEEYACYKQAVCERQPTGECGWTPTDELESCIADLSPAR